MTYPNFIPHGVCLLWRWPLILTIVLGELLVAGAYLAIPLELLSALRRSRVSLSPRARRIVADFALFILFCGGGHLLSIFLLWKAWYWPAALWTLFGTAVFSWRSYLRIARQSDYYVALLSVPVTMTGLHSEIADLRRQLDDYRNP